MSSFRIAVVFGALAIASVAADAQTPGRVRGTITAIDKAVKPATSAEDMLAKLSELKVPTAR